MGRKPLDTEAKLAPLAVRFSQFERDKVQAAAVAAGVSVSAWVREVALAAADAVISELQKKPKE